MVVERFPNLSEVVRVRTEVGSIFQIRSEVGEFEPMSTELDPRSAKCSPVLTKLSLDSSTLRRCRQDVARQSSHSPKNGSKM